MTEPHSRSGDEEKLTQLRQLEDELLKNNDIATLNLSKVPDEIPLFLREGYCLALQFIVNEFNTQGARAESMEWFKVYYRLIHYPNVLSAWKSVTNGPQNNRQNKGRPDAIGSSILTILISIYFKFIYAPKRTKQERNKKLGKAAELLEKLKKLMDQDIAVDEILEDSIQSYLGIRVLEFAASSNRKMKYWQDHYPSSAAIYRGRTIFSKEPCNPPDDSLAISDSYGEWLRSEIIDLDFKRYLNISIVRLRNACNEKIEIPQPRRTDHGYVSYLIKEISYCMQTIHGQPFDTAVATFASALADLDEPLTRDDVKGRTQKKSNIKK